MPGRQFAAGQLSPVQTRRRYAQGGTAQFVTAVAAVVVGNQAAATAAVDTRLAAAEVGTQGVVLRARPWDAGCTAPLAQVSSFPLRTCIARTQCRNDAAPSSHFVGSRPHRWPNQPAIPHRHRHRHRDCRHRSRRRLLCRLPSRRPRSPLQRCLPPPGHCRCSARRNCGSTDRQRQRPQMACRAPA